MCRNKKESEVRDSNRRWCRPLFRCFLCNNNEKDKPQNDDDTSLHVFRVNPLSYVAERQRKQVEKTIPLEFFFLGGGKVHGLIMNRVHRLSFSRLF